MSRQLYSSVGQCGRCHPWLLAARSLTGCSLTGKVTSTDRFKIGYQRSRFIAWRRSQVSCLCTILINGNIYCLKSSHPQPNTSTCLCIRADQAHNNHPPQKPHVYRLPTPGWVPPSRPNKSLPPALPQPKTAGTSDRRNLINSASCNVGRPATKSFCPPKPTRSEASTKAKRMVGQLRRASVLQHQTQWIGNKRLCVPGSVSSPQAFLIFLNHGTPSQLTMRCDVEMREDVEVREEERSNRRRR
jgi:hypothetical protein